MLSNITVSALRFATFCLFIEAAAIIILRKKIDMINFKKKFERKLRINWKRMN